jgi:hypothetical protein
VPGGQRDHERAARRQVAAGRDEAVALEQRQRVVDSASPDDAVEVEAQADGSLDEQAGAGSRASGLREPPPRAGRAAISAKVRS